MPTADGLNLVQEYRIDAWRRSVLTLDALRRRGNGVEDDRRFAAFSGRTPAMQEELFGFPDRRAATGEASRE